MADQYKKWNLICSNCSHRAELTCWGEHLPTQCSCTGRYKEESTGKAIGVSQKDQILEELAELNK